MSRSIGLLLLLSILAADAALPARPAPVLMVYGDSLSAGYGLSPGRGWVDLLGRRLADEGYEFRLVNASVSGETTAGGLERLPRAIDVHRPAVVILELGANDGLRGLPPEATRQNLARMVQLLRSRGARILLVGIRLPPNYGPRYSSEFDALYQAVATRERVALVPFLLDGVATQRALMQDDNLHPNERAQPRLLENIWSRLRPLLRSAARERKAG
ncbi:MAG: arylesterase [Gammaproteobacteria bacterium]|nr:arylesterase [Gammaproteobacteria bacterium]